MRINTRILQTLLLGAALPLAAGCDSAASRSAAHLERLSLDLRNYEKRHGVPPDSIEQLAEFFSGEEDLREVLYNPLTGDDPGYVYVKPPPGVLGSSLARRVVVLYQSRGGEPDHDLPVGFAEGTTGEIQPDSLVATVPRWREFAPSQSRFSVSLPRAPESDGGDASQRSYTAGFCGLVFSVLEADQPLLHVFSRDDPRAMLRLLRDEIAADLGGRTRESREIDLGGVPGLAAEIVMPEEDTMVRVRWYRHGRRLFCLSVSGPIGSLNEENAGRFFESFAFAQDPNP